MHEAPRTKSTELRESLEKTTKDESLAPEERVRAYRDVIAVADDEKVRLTRTPDEEEQLRAVQERLGMTTLHNEASDGILESKREQSVLDRTQALREGASELTEATLSFGNELGRRDKNGMDPFLDARSFATFKNGYQRLRVFSEKKETEVASDELATAITMITQGLKQFGGMPRGGVIREDTESLGRLAHYVRNLEEVAAKLGKRLIEGDENAGGALRELRIICNKIYDFALKKRSVLRNH